MARQARGSETEETADNGAVSAGVQRLIDGIKRPFLAYSQQFIKLAETRAALAPSFMKACRAWQAETNGTFVAFVTLLDPSVPADREARKSHKVFNAATYLQRLVSAGAGGGRARTTPLRSRMTDTARLIKTLEPLVSDKTAFWAGLAAELGLKQRQVTRLKQVVASVQPLLDLRRIAPQQVRIVHMEPEAEASAVRETEPSVARRRLARAG